jgi:hypothetical protein
MEINETLHNCLMAIASRYPHYSVDIDTDVWGQQSGQLHVHTPLALLDQLNICAPQFLYLAAHVECEGSSCEIRVLDMSQERPAFRFHPPRVALLR